jgi:hypothetical protein
VGFPIASWSGYASIAAMPSTWGIDVMCHKATGWIYDIRFNEPSRGLAILRAHSMKSCPAGLIVRFFNVTIPTCTGRIGKSTGNAFIEKRLPLKRREDAERTAKNRPVARRAV